MSRISRRDVFRTTGILAASAATGEAEPATVKTSGPEVYTRIGVRPFINCTATYTINGGSQMLPEVIATIEQASHYHVNIDELMAKVSERLAQLLQVPWGIVTAGRGRGADARDGRLHRRRRSGEDAAAAEPRRA